MKRTLELETTQGTKKFKNATDDSRSDTDNNENEIHNAMDNNKNAINNESLLEFLNRLLKLMRKLETSDFDRLKNKYEREASKNFKKSNFFDNAIAALVENKSIFIETVGENLPVKLLIPLQKQITFTFRCISLNFQQEESSDDIEDNIKSNILVMDDEESQQEAKNLKLLKDLHDLMVKYNTDLYSTLLDKSTSIDIFNENIHQLQNCGWIIITKVQTNLHLTFSFKNPYIKKFSLPFSITQDSSTSSIYTSTISSLPSENQIVNVISTSNNNNKSDSQNVDKGLQPQEKWLNKIQLEENEKLALLMIHKKIEARKKDGWQTDSILEASFMGKTGTILKVGYDQFLNYNKKLAKEKLIERTESISDSRNKQLTITKIGREYIKELLDSKDDDQLTTTTNVNKISNNQEITQPNLKKTGKNSNLLLLIINKNIEAKLQGEIQEDFIYQNQLYTEEIYKILGIEDISTKSQNSTIRGYVTKLSENYLKKTKVVVVGQSGGSLAELRISDAGRDYIKIIKGQDPYNKFKLPLIDQLSSNNNSNSNVNQTNPTNSAKKNLTQPAKSSKKKSLIEMEKSDAGQAKKVSKNISGNPDIKKSKESKQSKVINLVQEQAADEQTNDAHNETNSIIIPNSNSNIIGISPQHKTSLPSIQGIEQQLMWKNNQKERSNTQKNQTKKVSRKQSSNSNHGNSQKKSITFEKGSKPYYFLLIIDKAINEKNGKGLDEDFIWQQDLNQENIRDFFEVKTYESFRDYMRVLVKEELIIKEKIKSLNCNKIRITNPKGSNKIIELTSGKYKYFDLPSIGNTQSNLNSNDNSNVNLSGNVPSSIVNLDQEQAADEETNDGHNETNSIIIPNSNSNIIGISPQHKTSLPSIQGIERQLMWENNQKIEKAQSNIQDQKNSAVENISKFESKQ